MKKSSFPKSPKAPKANVLGPIGRSQQPGTMVKPGSVTAEFAREQDVEQDDSEYKAPKKRK